MGSQDSETGTKTLILNLMKTEKAAQMGSFFYC